MNNIDAVIKSLAKKYGVYVRGPGDGSSVESVDVISTGILPLDIALGRGGIPRGHFTEIYAPEGMGKTTLALHIIASAQSSGLLAAYIDIEGRIDPEYAGSIGVDMSKVYVISPPHGDAALESARAFVSTGEIGIVVIDSVAALVPKMELEGDVTDQLPGLQARLMSKHLRQMTPEIKKTNTAVIFTNQLRYKIMTSYGNPETRPGGVALRYYASISMDMRRVGWLSDSSGDKIGAIIKIETKKNSLAPPYRSAKVPIIFGSGFSNEMAVLEMAESIGTILKSGSWYSFEDMKFHGKNAIADAMREDKDMMESISHSVMIHYGLLDKDSNNEDEHQPISD